ncbi:ROK family protein [Agromyces sp. CFH 90414]|uniref:ROK family protein n=1 Tax=Agromyces agglutinans TaxID=2662258 RepID=A0A6I2FGK2_9MICO|nr:ROK family transcriptional regulator [Agromyces agglutinans]MRG61726.1 ROK family protein [Agromyces agglutinans]
MAASTSTGTPSWLGAVNDRVGLSALLDHGPLTRIGICEIVGVSKPTASLMMSRLIAAGVVEEQGLRAGAPGRNAVLYAARLDRPLGVAVDLDAHELRASVVDAAGGEHPVVRRALPRGASERSAEREIARAIDDACAADSADPAEVRTVCVGIPGYVDPGGRGELFTETLPGWPVHGLHDRLEQALGRTVYIENDVNLAAIAERRHGAGLDHREFALLWLGNGVGAAFDLSGELYRGTYGGAGEIGFLPVPAAAVEIDPDARTVQDLVGGAAVRRVIAGDRPTADERERLAERIAWAALPLLATLDPGCLVLAGPNAALGGPELAAAVEAAVRRISRWYPTVLATGVIVDPVLAGAREFLRGRVREQLLDTVARVAVA